MRRLPLVVVLSALAGACSQSATAPSTATAANADGTITGTFRTDSPDHVTLFMLPISQTAPRQSCNGTFNWRLTPR